MVPATATPKAAPTCRLVDAIAAATPTCDKGIPATALFVIAGLIMPQTEAKQGIGQKQQRYWGCGTQAREQEEC